VIMSGTPDGAGGPMRPGDALVQLLNPVALIALLMIGGVMFLLLSAIFGWDTGHVLFRMAQPDFARGLITYLFTIVTIGTAVVLIISALLGGSKEHFDRGKEILGLLLGVFGTMVGFYFGSELANAHARLTVSPPLMSVTEVVSGGDVTLTALIEGGRPPYRFGVAFGESPAVTYDQQPQSGGWIVAHVSAPTVSDSASVGVTVGVIDSNGDTASTTATLKVKLR